MKKPLLIVCVLGIVSWAAWQLAPSEPKSAILKETEDVRLAGQTETSPINSRQPSARTNQFDLSRHVSAPEVTSLVFTSFVGETATGTIAVVVTQTVPVGFRLGPTEAEINTALEQRRQKRELRRQELRAQSQYQEMFAKEDEWKQRAKGLKVGMTLQEILALMGSPTEVTTWVDAGPEHLEPVSVPTNALAEIKIVLMAYVYYSPDGKIPTGALITKEDIEAAESSFNTLRLILDEQGKLTRVPPIRP